MFETKAYLELEAYSEHCQTSSMERFAKLAHSLIFTLKMFLIFWEMKLFNLKPKKT